MKYLKKVSLLLFSGLVFIGCSDDDDGDTPDAVNQEEVITTMTVTLISEIDADEVVLRLRDLDGDGPEAPEVTGGSLVTGERYLGTIVLLNETVTPADNITLEVEEEDEEHQFFYIPDADLNVTTTYGNFDSNQNPLGTEFALIAGEPSTGTLTISLIHEPKKPNDGTLADAGGESDIDAVFPITVE